MKIPPCDSCGQLTYPTNIWNFTLAPPPCFTNSRPVPLQLKLCPACAGAVKVQAIGRGTELTRRILSRKSKE